LTEHWEKTRKGIGMVRDTRVTKPIDSQMGDLRVLNTSAATADLWEVTGDRSGGRRG
jgi:hypothetical protein